MLVLQPGEVCPYSLRCPYVKRGITSGHPYQCRGMDPNRNYVFTCKFVKENGVIEDGYMRTPEDKTGKMKIIMENGKNGTRTNN